VPNSAVRMLSNYLRNQMVGAFSVAALWIEIGLVWLETTTSADFQPMPAPGNQRRRTGSEETPKRRGSRTVPNAQIRFGGSL
jgi:hypothetical protein